jgi:hypothetical protein
MVIFHDLPIKNGDFPWFFVCFPWDLHFSSSLSYSPGLLAGSPRLQAVACPDLLIHHRMTHRTLHLHLTQAVMEKWVETLGL